MVVVVTAVVESLAVAPASAAAPEVTVLRDTQLDPAALYFVSFDGLVNNASYQQDAIVSFAGFQYAAWYTASRSAVVARRRLPAGAWEIAVLPHPLSTNDSH
ncbi:MAG TPA: BNR-4 repeat-containing protein, partial [Kofleriaceae bacterium]|nr:BNR-4 repeat-containing protein [Kofleriaceae bacterium]